MLLLALALHTLTPSTLPREVFHGCRARIVDCQLACPDKLGMLREEPERCDVDVPEDKYACYCTFNGST